MFWQLSPYLLPLVTSAVLPCCLAFFALRRPGAAGARSFVALMLAAALWSVGDLVEAGVVDAAVAIDLRRWLFLIGDLVPVAWFVFAAQYAAGSGRQILSRVRVVGLTIVPLVSLIVAATRDPMGLLWTNLQLDAASPLQTVHGDAGPWFWIDTVYSYALVTLGLGLLGWSLFRSRRLYRKHIVLLTLGVLIPWVADVSSAVGLSPYPDLDLTPMACTITAALFAWGFFRFHFLDVMPVARDVVFEGLSDPVIVVDAFNRIVDLNAAAERALGIRGSMATGRAAPDVLKGWPELVHEADVTGETGAEMTLTVDSEQRWFDLRVSQLRKGNTAAAGRLIVLRDVTERKRLEQRLAEQAYQDALTGLANRARFHECLRAAITSDGASVLMLDLDDFKNVNDSLGHAAGDSLLIHVAERLRSCVGPDGIAARLGGDEFAVLLSAPLEAAIALASRILEALESPVLLAGRELRIRASIGIATASAGTNSTDALRNADIALYSAKSNGKSRFAVFDASMERRAIDRLELETAFRRALDRGELGVFYQPIVSLESDRIVQFEALARWNDPVRGAISPATFIPLAEQTGLIVPLGQFVLEQACRDARAWQDAYPGARTVSVAINLSARQFQHPSIVADIESALADAGLAPEMLTLEITESVAMQDADNTVRTLDRLKALGVRVAIDDFGTGYSSLSYLKRFPVDALKIDRSFVDGLGEDGQDTAIVEMIVALARSLGVGLTAEGIETEAQRAHLAHIRCERGQGYLFARPMPAYELNSLFAPVRHKRAA